MENLGSVMGPLANHPKVREAMDQMGPLSDEELERRLAEIDQRQQAEAYNKIKTAEVQRFARFSVWGGDQQKSFSFDQWLPEKQENTSLAKDLKDRARHLAFDIIKGTYDNGRVLVSGEAGCGKTAMVLAMINAIKDHSQKTVMFVNVTELASDIHNFNDIQVKEKVQHTKDLMKKADVLVIDDFGSETMGKSGNGYASNPLQMFYYEVAEARMLVKDGHHVFTTIVTTNNKVSELAKMFEPKIVSRLITKDPKGQLSFKGLEDVR